MPRKRKIEDSDYAPELDKIKKRRMYNSRRTKASRKLENLQQHSKRTREDRRLENSLRTKEKRKVENSKRTKEKRKLENAARRLKSDITGMEYDVASPFPPTTEQLRFTGQILGNSIAALFAQQSPSPEISYAAVVAEQLTSYTRPIIDFTLYQFRNECCLKQFGDINISRAAANKALNSLDKILLINDHYQLMFDFSVYDIYNPPSLTELKKLSTRHPYQPVSAILREDVDSCRKVIHSHIESVIKYRLNNPEYKDDIFDDCPIVENEDPCARYRYPPFEKYLRHENNIICNIMAGRHCESLNPKDFKISFNELIAFQINSEAKFAKVYRKGARKCFLMPADFKDDAMRQFYRHKFEQFEEFCDRGGEVVKDNKQDSFFEVDKLGVSKGADFVEEHSMRRRVQLEYARDNNFVGSEEGEVEHQPKPGSNVLSSNSYSVPMEECAFVVNSLSRRMDSSKFNDEAESARKHYLDARDVCLTAWEVRNDTYLLVEKLCKIIKDIVVGKHEECQCEAKEAPICDALVIQADQYLMELREANKDMNNGRYKSQLVDDTLIRLEDICNLFKQLFSTGDCKDVDKHAFHERIESLREFYLKLGTQGTCLFYEKLSIYEKLKSTLNGVCCVCGIRCLIPEKSGELKNAEAFRDLLKVEDDEVVEWEALKRHEEDELGELAKQCFHIEYVEHDKKHYHILHINDPSEDNAMEKSCCLIKDGRLSKLPACDDCFDRLKKAYKHLREEKPSTETPASVHSNSDSNGREKSKLNEAIGMLKRLSFKRCDLGRIPKSLLKLCNSGRTAIAPFTAYTIIRQLRSSKHLPGSAQHSTKGSKFSIPSEGVSGKEFVIPLTHEDFINSFQRQLPRENVAERHRVLFLGNNSDWNSIESTLNRQARGQSFDVMECYNLLKLLKRTKALASDFSVKRKSSLGLLQRKVDIEMSRITNTTDSSTGIILEPSSRVHQMEDSCSDDVAAARLLIENNGVKTTAPGISTSMF